MNQDQRNALWDIFVTEHEARFKEIMGYGKEEIESIGVEKFFDEMGWTEEDHLNSYLTDRLHLVPCIECKKSFAVYEDDLGLCEACQKTYDIDSVFAYSTDIAKQTGQDVTSTCKQMCAAFYMSKEFRDTFRTDIPADQPSHALVRKAPKKDKNLGWRVLPLEELRAWKEKYPAGEFQIIRHDGAPLEKNEKTIFSDLNDILV